MWGVYKSRPRTVTSEALRLLLDLNIDSAFPPLTGHIIVDIGDSQQANQTAEIALYNPLSTPALPALTLYYHNGTTRVTQWVANYTRYGTATLLELYVGLSGKGLRLFYDDPDSYVTDTPSPTLLGSALDLIRFGSLRKIGTNDLPEHTYRMTDVAGLDNGDVTDRIGPGDPGTDPLTFDYNPQHGTSGSLLRDLLVTTPEFPRSVLLTDTLRYPLDTSSLVPSDAPSYGSRLSPATNLGKVLAAANLPNGTQSIVLCLDGLTYAPVQPA